MQDAVSKDPRFRQLVDQGQKAKQQLVKVFQAAKKPPKFHRAHSMALRSVELSNLAVCRGSAAQRLAASQGCTAHKGSPTTAATPQEKPTSTASRGGLSSAQLFQPVPVPLMEASMYTQNVMQFRY